MKRLLIAMMLMPFACVTAKKCPILPETTQISYTTYTNSGIAINQTYEISDSLIVWKYTDYRNGVKKTDERKINKQEYEKLVKELSAISFSVKKNDSPEAGGEGWGCSFYKNGERYLSFNCLDHFSGDYQKALTLIEQFVKSHPIASE